MDFRQLRYFTAVGQLRNFSQAAERCYVSQSAISHQIAKLEQDLGVKLFDRSTRNVELTAAGERLMPVAAEALAVEAKAREVVREPRNRIRITANMSFAAQSLEAIAAVREVHPNLDIEFVLRDFADRMAAVTSGDADVALIRGEVDRPGLQSVSLGMQDLLVAMSRRHPLARSGTVGLRALGDYPLLLPARHSQVLIHQVVERAFREIGRKVQLGPPIPADHTASLEVITQPRAWTVLYAESAGGTPVAGLSLLHEAEHRLRVPVRAVLSPALQRSVEFHDLIAALRRSNGAAEGAGAEQ
ncbi:LysR family transcriptional regulator [Tomitella gaofuii]|uniref:LysR family transcriptional regulator n=1 Tax=Tomitella gaofuii TaxID=2760083 RepID=UPI0015FB6BB7|nr:LysR family transcriptional regulator [Tomitella gaofuii]